MSGVNHSLVVAWNRSTAQKPITAPTSIIPSTPRLSTPERSASSSPSAPKSSGVPYATPDAISVTRSELFTAPPPVRWPAAPS